MIIGIDGNEANITARVGVGQYAYHLLLALSQIDRQNQYHIYLKSPPLFDLPPSAPNWQYHIFGPQKLWTRLALPLHLHFGHQHLDLFFSPSHYSPQLSPFPTIPTIHDLGYLRFKDQFTKKDLYQLTSWTKHSLDHAARVIAVSEFTKNELTQIYHLPPSKITVAPNGVGDMPHLSTQTIKSVLAKFKILNSKFFLYLGTLKPNKNIPFLIKSFSRFLSQHPDFLLVIAGKKGWLFKDIFETVQKLHFEDKIIFTDYVSEPEKFSLLKAATALILPSTYEGFGIPAIESIKVGTPVIASRIPVFTEVIGQAGLFINPQNENDLVNKMGLILNLEIRQKLIAPGYKQSQKYSWTKTAQQLLSAFNQV